MKRIYRFHTHGWTDIAVDVDDKELEGLSEEEIDDFMFQEADDLYNQGDENAIVAEDFENTDCEDITDCFGDLK